MNESQEPDVQETLHWYAFNYRQAHTAQAHEMWLELEQFVDRKMKAPQRTEQERDEILQAITDPENQPSQFGTVTLDYHFEKIKKWEDLFERMSANFERVSDKVLAQRTEQEPVAVKRMKEWVEFLKRQSDNGQHMNIPSSFGAGTCWELAIELEQFINTTPPQRTEPLIGCVNHDCDKCKPLTNDELADLWYKQSLDWMEFARAIEAAHGIKENT